MKNISVNEYNELVTKDQYLIIDFYADWCGPCKMLAPVVEKVSAEFDENYNFVKVNVDNEQQIAIDNKIYTIPTIVIYKAGKEIARRGGYMSEDDFRNFIKNNCI